MWRRRGPGLVFWRQSQKTVADLFAAGASSAPGFVACMVMGGWGVGCGGYFLTEKSVTAVLSSYQVYAHMNAYLFWLLYGVMIERLIEPFLVGSCVAAAARAREMITSMMLVFAICAVSGAELARSRHY